MRVYKIFLLAIVFVNTIAQGQTKDFGQRGHVFPIKEKNILEEVKEKARVFSESEDFLKFQEDLQTVAKSSIQRPQKVEGLFKAKENRIWYIDPTYTQKTDIKDNNDTVVIKAGTSINPLETVSWGDDLIFIDGDDEKQVSWSLEREGKIVLISGAPLLLSKQHKRIFYFDQSGVLVRQLKIQVLPSVISQEGLSLKVEEVAL